MIRGNLQSYSQIPQAAEAVLKEVDKRISESKVNRLSDSDLLSLHSVFGEVLQRALDILEKYPTLTVYVTTNRLRSLIEVKGQSDRCYRLFPSINFCPCLAFKHQVIEKKTQILCKHVLAARLAQLLNRTDDHLVTPEQYLMLLKSMYEENKPKT